MITYHYVAVLDILGYKDFLENDIRNQTLGFKDTLQVAFRVFDDVNRGDFSYTTISDTIIIRCSQRNDLIKFLQLLKNIFVSFAENEILIRGGLSYDQHFENPSITYSKALIESHKLEHNIAIYPRILLHESLVALAQNINADTEIKRQKLLLKWGNYYQIHVIDRTNWLTIFTGVKSMFYKQKDHICSDINLYNKYLWLQNYLFEFKPSNIRKHRFLKEWTLYR